MNWNDSHKFVENLTPIQRKRYRELVTMYSNIPVDGHEAHIDACNDLEKEINSGLYNEETGEGKRQGEVDITLRINTYTGEIFALSGDREPCIHGYPPCCDTEYIGLEWLKRRMIRRN